MTSRSGSDPVPRPVFNVDIVALLRSPGVRRPFRSGAAMVGLRSSDVVVDGDVEVDLVLEAVGSDVVATGRLDVDWTGTCRRCLDEIAGHATIEVAEVFETDPTEGETYLRGAEEIVLDPMVREAVVLGLPIAPLCREDCLGPDPDRYPARAGGDTEPSADPRWAALDQLRPDGGDR